MNITSERKLSYILGVSRPTLAKWRRQGLVTPLDQVEDKTKSRYLYDVNQARQQLLSAGKNVQNCVDNSQENVEEVAHLTT